MPHPIEGFLETDEYKVDVLLVLVVLLINTSQTENLFYGVPLLQKLVCSFVMISSICGFNLLRMRLRITLLVPLIWLMVPNLGIVFICLSWEA